MFAEAENENNFDLLDGGACWLSLYCCYIQISQGGVQKYSDNKMFELHRLYQQTLK